MPRRSKIKTEVPADIREKLNAELVGRGFADYAPVTDWLNGLLQDAGLNVTVSVMAVNRYGSEFQRQFEAEMAESNQMYHIAKLAVAQNEDSQGIVRDAATSLLQTRLLKITVALKELQEKSEAGDLHKIAETTSKLTRALADLGRLDIASQKYKRELEEAVLAGRLDVLKLLAEFIEKQFPHFKKAFAEILKPFAEFLTGSNG